VTTTIQTGFLSRRFLSNARFAVVLGTMVLATTSEATIIDGYSSARHDRFSSGGFEGSPVSNPDFFLAGSDLSGVGIEIGGSNRPLTMISPIHFLASRHFPPSGTVTFVNQDDEIKTYTISTTAAVVDPSFPGTETDLLVGTLTEAIPASDKIAFYPTLDYASLSEFDNAELLPYGKQHRVGRNELDGEERLLSGSANNFRNINVSGNIGFVAAYDYDPATGFSPDESRFEGSDSGYPTFIRVGSQLGLAGIHWAIGTFDDGTPANFDTFVPFYRSEVNDILAGSGYSLQTIVIPEPASFLLLSIAGIPCVLSRRTRRFASRSATFEV